MITSLVTFVALTMLLIWVMLSAWIAFRIADLFDSAAAGMATGALLMFIIPLSILAGVTS